MLHEDEAQTLRELGLTLLQAKVYLALVSLGNTTAGKTAKLSKVARQEVYRIINELSEAGLVSRIVATPTMFKPLPLSEGLSLLLERRIKKTSELQAKVREVFHKNINKRETNNQSNYEFRMVPEKAPWFKYRTEMVEKKYQTFDLLTTVKRFSSRMVYDEEPYKKGAKRGAKIRILTEKPHRNSPILASINALREYPNFKFRYTYIEPQVILVIPDQKEAALAISPSNRVGPPYLVSNHPSFVQMAQQYFETLWNKAKE
jgi:sugar-specific transcriptional regulator TrmB